MILYQNTGFNPVNLPYDKDVLEAAAGGVIELDEPPREPEDRTDYDCTLSGIYPLDHVDIRQNSVSDLRPYTVDYLYISGAYYTVIGCSAIDTDTYRLYLSPDPFMTLGGITNIVGISGRWERKTGLKDCAGSTGHELLSDPLFIPEKQPIIVASTIASSPALPDFYTRNVGLIAATVDLYQVGPNADAEVDSKTGVPKDYAMFNVDMTEEEAGTKAIVAFATNPAAPPAGSSTVQVALPNLETASPWEDIIDTKTSGYELFLYEDTKVQAAIKYLHYYGMLDGVIVGSARIPSQYFDGAPYSVSSGARTYRNKVMTGGKWPDLVSVYAGNKLPTDLEEAVARASEVWVRGVMSPASGQSIEHRASVQSRVPSIGAFVGINGYPYCVLVPDGEHKFLGGGIGDTDPATGKGSLSITTLFAVSRYGIQGAPWQTVPISVSMGSGAGLGLSEMLMNLNQASILGETQKKQNYVNNALSYLNNINLSIGNAAGTQATAGSSAMNSDTYSWNDYTPVGGEIRSFSHAHNESHGTNNSLSGSANFGISATGMLNSAINTALLHSSDPALSANAMIDLRRGMYAQKEYNGLLSKYYYQPPTVTGISFASMQEATCNAFVQYSEMPDPDDIKRWAQIATYFGIACDKPLEPGMTIITDASWGLDEDENYPCYYMKTAGAQIARAGDIKGQNSTTERARPDVKLDAAKLLDNGVRFWRIKPGPGPEQLPPWA